MGRRTKIVWNGKEVEGESIEWTTMPKSEQWSRYVAEDGSKILVKTLLTKLVRLDERDAEGAPLVVAYTSNTIICHTPPHLMVLDGAPRTAGDNKQLEENNDG